MLAERERDKQFVIASKAKQSQNSPKRLGLPRHFVPRKDVKSAKSFSTFTSHPSPAFTLAEVLITLGIIGVVAAMTIPLLINSYQEKSYLTQYKKVYTILSQAYLQASQDNGTAASWATAQEAYDYIVPYLSTSTNCGYATFCTRPTRNNIKNLNGVVIGGDPSLNRYHLALSDGALIHFITVQTTAPSGGDNQTDKFDNNVAYTLLLADVNGLKEPNQYGYDVFLFSLTTRGGSPIVIGGSAKWNEIYFSDCQKGETTGTPGRACSWWVYRHGNLDYLHRNIPKIEWNQ